MNKTTRLLLQSIFLLVIYFNSSAQTQIGADIFGAPPTRQGQKVAINNEGDIIASTTSTNINIYKNNSGTWSLLGTNINDVVGYSVSMNNDGTIVAGGNRSANSSTGEVKVFKYSSSTDQWSQIGNTIFGESSGDQFGSSVSLNETGTIVAVGAPRNDGSNSDTNFDGGRVKVYQYDSTSSSWIQLGSSIDGLLKEYELDPLCILS
ncbi:hypothetical protein [uncultured Polaribacter sp.]|uniref:hypothetical protein n=1 Tax=uncultured Polaribacter sp. TaxID=174711 RepID=UPI002637D21D|nr:hypothetical protein [uncultured Polaribacter sp.]